MKVKFTIYEKLNKDSIDKLELGERANNCLKRAKIHTVGELIENIHNLNGIRNCGVKTEMEIKNALISYEIINSPDICNYILGIIKE